MKRALMLLGACVVLVVGLASFAQAVKTPSLLVRDVLSKKQSVPAARNPKSIQTTDFRKAFVYCPSGWYATGGGVYSGAIKEIVSAPTADRRGWFVDGFNDDPKGRTFTHQVTAVCVKGGSALTVRKASLSADQVRQLEQEAIATHNTRAGG